MGSVNLGSANLDYTCELSATLDPHKKEESSIQRHAQFWDKANKGYITPLDTISGFITLGYSMFFSIAIGAFVGVFLSLSTQNGWFPDPLCRSSVRNLIRAKKQTQNNMGAFDQDGVFNLEKFEILFDKHAKSDKSGNTITLIELVNMTKEQEALGYNVKAWTTSFIELCTAYFFIGHRGYLTKDDVRAAYDGSLFYRLTDENRLRIEDKQRSKSGGTLLKGPYLSKPTAMLSPKALEHRLKVLLSSLQSKSSLASEYGVNEWITYVQQKVDEIKNQALRRPPSIINGVTTPRVYRKDKELYNSEDVSSDFLTGVAKEHDVEPAITEEYLSGLLSRSGSEELPVNGNETHATMSSSGIFTVDASFIKHSPPIQDEEEPLMSAVLRQDEPISSELTGVQSEDKKASEAEHSSSSSSSVEKEEQQELKPEEEEEQQELKPEEEEQQETKSEEETEVPEPTITPPPEEKLSENQLKKTNSKKGKKKNKQTSEEVV